METGTFDSQLRGKLPFKIGNITISGNKLKTIGSNALKVKCNISSEIPDQVQIFLFVNVIGHSRQIADVDIARQQCNGIKSDVFPKSW